jgi:hypothetical protein
LSNTHRALLQRELQSAAWFSTKSSVTFACIAD